MNPAIAISEPNKNSQHDKALRHGNATFGTPTCNGGTRLANPNTIGMA